MHLCPTEGDPSVFGGESGAYQKVVLSVSPVATFSVYVCAGNGPGQGGDSGITTVTDQNGTVVACEAASSASLEVAG